MRFLLLLVAVALTAVPHSAPAAAQGIEFGPQEAPARSKRPRKPAPLPPTAPLEGGEQDAAAAAEAAEKDAAPQSRSF